MSDSAFLTASNAGHHGATRTLGTLALAVIFGLAGLLTAQQLVLPAARSLISDPPPLLQSGVVIGAAGLIFVCVLAGLAMGVRWIHGRPALSLMTSSHRFRWMHLVQGAVSCSLMLAVAGYIIDPTRSFVPSGADLSIVATAGGLMLAGFFLQTATEEAIFRGYVTQVAYRAFRSPWSAMATSVVLFTGAHFGNGLDSAVFSLVFAIGLSLIVWRLDGLEFAIGVHFANNLVTAVMFEDVSDLTAQADDFQSAELIGLAVVMVLLVGLASLIRRRVRGAPL